MIFLFFSLFFGTDGQSPPPLVRGGNGNEPTSMSLVPEGYFQPDAKTQEELKKFVGRNKPNLQRLRLAKIFNSMTDTQGREIYLLTEELAKKILEHIDAIPAISRGILITQISGGIAGLAALILSSFSLYNTKGNRDLANILYLEIPRICSAFISIYGADAIVNRLENNKKDHEEEIEFIQKTVDDLAIRNGLPNDFHIIQLFFELIANKPRVFKYAYENKLFRLTSSSEISVNNMIKKELFDQYDKRSEHYQFLFSIFSKMSFTFGILTILTNLIDIVISANAANAKSYSNTGNGTVYNSNISDSFSKTVFAFSILSPVTNLITIICVAITGYIRHKISQCNTQNNKLGLALQYISLMFQTEENERAYNDFSARTGSHSAPNHTARSGQTLTREGSNTLTPQRTIFFFGKNS